MNVFNKREILEYFRDIQNPTGSEIRILEMVKNSLDDFEVFSVTRDDFSQLGFDMSAVSDSHMQEIASYMGARYIDGPYVNHLTRAAKRFKLKQVES